MKPLAALAALTIAFATTLAPALARTSYVVDDAHLLSPSAVAQINQKVADFNAQTGKEIVVVTTPSLDGQSPDAAIEKSFAQQQVNGVEIFIAQKEHQIRIAGDTASRRFFPSGSFQTIAQSMRDSFRSNDYDGGVENAVSLIINQYLSHAGSLPRNRGAVTTPHVSRGQTGGFSLGWIWWIIILAVIFFVIRGIFRAMSGPRMMPPGYGGGPGGYGGGPGYGGPGYGGPGYGGGGFGGGGGFWSGMLGGLGGAFLGNELFGRHDQGYVDPNVGAAGFDPNVNQQQDASGWQSDPGQIDTSNMGGTDWGSGGGGGGDSGGGWGGGDSGGSSGGDGGW